MEGEHGYAFWQVVIDPNFLSCNPDCCINSYILVRETPLYKGYFAHWPVRLRFTPSKDNPIVA